MTASIPQLSAALASVERWPVEDAAAGVVRAGTVLGTVGPSDRPFRLASISKVITAYGVHIAIEEGTASLDDAVGQHGCTLRHLLCHAGGYGFDGDEPIARPGSRRGYSNTGYELIGAHLAARSGIACAEYLGEAVLAPLGMSSTDVSGSPAKDFVAPLADLLRFAAELLEPTLLAPATWAGAVRPAFPELAGIVPGVGRFSPCPWGLGPELRDAKSPHWTGALNSPATYGHFGGSGTFLWVDPVAGVAAIGLTDREFGPWALEAWPTFSDAVLAALGAAS